MCTLRAFKKREKNREKTGYDYMFSGSGRSIPDTYTTDNLKYIYTSIKFIQ